MAFDVPDQSGGSFLVTGANSGLGLETTRMLAGAGAHVVMAVRDTAKGRDAAAGIEGSTEVVELDLASLASVRALVEGWERPLAGVICNAGIMMVPEGRTADGFELQLGTNHLGHFALVGGLLPHVSTDDGRVVAVSSLLHRGPQIDLDDLDLAREGYDPTRAYQRSKLANLLFVAELQRRLAAAGSGVRATAAHPGYSATNLQSHHANPLAVRAMAIGNKVVATSAAEGARPTVYAATRDLVGGTFVGPSRLGGTRGRPAPAAVSHQAADAGVARRLWEVSEKLTGTTYPA